MALPHQEFRLPIAAFARAHHQQAAGLQAPGEKVQGLAATPAAEVDQQVLTENDVRTFAKETAPLVEQVVDPEAVVLSAPMLGMAGPPLPLPMLQGVAKLMTLLGKPTRPAWKWSEKPGEIPARRRDLLSHDAQRYADELWWREQRPELVMGPGSWGWVERAYASSRLLERTGAMEAVEVPVLIVSTSNDKLVSHPAAVRASERLPKGELVAFGPEAHHEILRETDDVRDRAMSAIEEFLDRVAPQTS